MAVDAELQNEAVAMMKEGRGPETIHAHLRARGTPDLEARALIEQLLVLKQQASAQDPKRLREEAKWMLFQGAPIDHVVAHFARVGIAEEHARPEIERIAAHVATMRPCQRCRAPVAAGESYFDGAGNEICRRCHSLDEIGNSERRVIEGAMEMVGIPAFAIQAGSGAYNYRSLRVPPYCKRCEGATGVHVNALHPGARAQVHPGWSYVCHRCMQGIC